MINKPYEYQIVKTQSLILDHGRSNYEEAVAQKFNIWAWTMILSKISILIQINPLRNKGWGHVLKTHGVRVLTNQ